jgi:transmembrane sensor
MTDPERLGPPPVEPMTDAAWSRIERGLWAQIDATAAPGSADASPPLRRWWLVAAPLAAAAAIAIVIVARTTTGELPALDEPARVVSGSAPSTVSFGDSHVELDANTAVVMNHEAGHPTVLLERGAAWFTVAPRLQRPEFVVRAGDATVRVVGTRFRVARSEERIAVDVERGLVDVQFRGAVVEVAASRRWSSESPAQTSILAGLAPPVDPIASGEPATSTQTPAEPVEPAPLHAKPTPRPGRDRAAPPSTAPGSAVGASPSAAIGATPDPTATSRSAELDRDRTEYDRLAAIEPRSPDAALTGYLALARGQSEWAALALFAAARLAADRHDRRAEALLGFYLVRFPTGANAADARQLRSRLKGSPP